MSLKAVFFALVAICCLGQQFVPMDAYIATTVCSYNANCINQQPNPIDGVVVAKTSTGVYFDQFDNPNGIAMFCPNGTYPDSADSYFRTCATYANKAPVSLCRSISYYPCNVPGPSLVPPCCKKWSDSWVIIFEFFICRIALGFFDQSFNS